MSRRRAVIGALLLLALVAAIGLAAGALRTPTHIRPGGPGLLSSAAITFPTILIAGFTDGLNPCAFTVLLVFVATVGGLYRDVEGAASAGRRQLFFLGGAFIFAIFVTYLALGTGLLRGATALTQNHVGTRLGALGAVFLGLWMLKDGLAPGWGPVLRAPSALEHLLHTWGRRTTLVGMTGLGALVGLCTVPCSGAVYLAVLGLLAMQESFARSYVYLVLYNVMFVAPLVAILVAASARPVLNRMAHWNHHHKEWVRLGMGSAVVLLGLAVLATV